MNRRDRMPPPVDMILTWHPSECDGPWWWRAVKRWLKPGFGHVKVAWLDPATGVWVRVDPQLGGIIVDTLPGCLTPDHIARYDITTASAVLFGVSRERHGHEARGIISCVSVIKSVAGIGGWSITPWQLYRHITKGLQHGSEAEEGQDGRARAEGREARAGGRGEAPRREEKAPG